MSSSHVFKYIDLRKTPSLELGLMLMCAYAPYGLAEGIHLSGIMAILFTGTATSRLLACFCSYAFCVLMLCRYRHVALHSQQPVSRHSSHCAATVANNSFHGGFVLRKHHKLCIIYSLHQRRITIIYLSLTETLVFAYLGLAIFSFHHNAEPSLIIWSIVSCRKKYHTKL